MFFYFSIVASCLIVAFGQPVWGYSLGLAAAFFGYALFWSVQRQMESRSRFWLGLGWFSTVQLIQLYWFVSHPYAYIYPVWILLSLFWGVQFGLLSVMVTPKRISRLKGILLIASVWTLMEWSRLFLLSGFSWNPVGMSLASHTHSLQTASLAGLFGMSFFVIAVNLMLLNFLYTKKRSFALCYFGLILFPFLWGAYQINAHGEALAKTKPLATLLVQTSFPIEENCPFPSMEGLKEYVRGEWLQILKITAPHAGKPCDLVALPEFVVPFGAHSFVYPFDWVKESFEKTYGKESIKYLPPLEYPLAKFIQGQWLVSNAYLAQSLSNQFNAPVVIGLEDAEDNAQGVREHYSSALLFEPFCKNYRPKRYAKQVLVPMGEYIPFSFCKDLAASYGIAGSFIPGKGPVIWEASGIPFGVSICYEETFGDLMCKSRQAGAKMLVNLTSDIWYPNSLLPKQHLEHARLRCVEAGIPLLRACNTGVTSAIDALGRNVAVLGEGSPDQESIQDSLYVNFSPYSFPTLYSKTGDSLIIGLSLIFALTGFRRKW